MENRTEFNLENNIQKWKAILTKKNNLTKSNIIELENHLIDLIDDLESKGLNEEESFIIAKKRIGKTELKGSLSVQSWQRKQFSHNCHLTIPE